MKTAGPRILIAMFTILSAMAFVGAFRAANGLDSNDGYVATHHPEKFAEAHANDTKMRLGIGIAFMLTASSFAFLHHKKML